MLGLIVPLVSKSPRVRVKRGPRLSILSSTAPQERLWGQSKRTPRPWSPPGSQYRAHAHLFFTVLHSAHHLFIYLPPKLGFVHCFISPVPKQCRANSRCSIHFWWVNKLGRKVYTEVCTEYELKYEALFFKICVSPIRLPPSLKYVSNL